jgi:hypothetical protein
MAPASNGTPTIGQSVALEDYKEALKAALPAADAVGDKLVTAAVSVATAYGAVIALVSPKESAGFVKLAVPFVGFALALGLGLWSQTFGVNLEPNDKLEDAERRIKKLIVCKRRTNRLALFALMVGIIVAGVIIANVYRPKPEVPKSAAIRLTSAGVAEVKAACSEPMPSASITGDLDPTKLTSNWITIEAPSPCSSAKSLTIPAKDVLSVRATT